jgi:3-deoxy-manno-octulosonate cytidylyltransferase (CMP-KDO synthetase)
MDEYAVAVIPARYASTRLPGKPLAPIGGRPMIRRVVERVLLARSVARVVVATDDVRVRDAVAGAGAEVVMTRADHPSGTDRLAEVAMALSHPVVVNVQGDLPLLDPAMVDRLVARMRADAALPMATLAQPIHAAADWHSPHVVKVVCDSNRRALYFSRSAIPHDRDGARGPGEPLGWRHVGLYAYRRDTLLALARLAPTPLERRESLEQLRALENGIAIGVEAWESGDAVIEVDVQADLERAEAALGRRGA